MTHTVPITQLTPDRPLVWETPTTLRVGFDRVVARVEAASPQTQRVIAMLVHGATAEELARHDPGEAQRVLDALRPALVARERLVGPVADQLPAEADGGPPTRLSAAPHAPVSPALRHASMELAYSARSVATRQRLRTAIYDDGRALPGLRQALEANRLCSCERSGDEPELAIEVLRYLEPLGRSSRWLRAGVPHLLIRFTDDAARVGPLVSASGAPCHGCEALHLTDQDPALPAISAQLYGWVPGSEAPETMPFVGAAAAHYIACWRRGARWVHKRQLILPVEHGALAALPSFTTLTTHPECGCAIRSAPRPPPRTATVAEMSAPHSRSPTAAVNRALS